MTSLATRTQPRLLTTAIALALATLSQQAAAQQTDPGAMQRVEVTGSSIKRLATEAALPVTTMKAEELTARGMTTLADFMMALPQSASLAPSNAGSGTNVNLRGLGVNRTLVLLNGRRLANEAIADGYANLDVIPISAIARVEVLRDGASSIYGSDAIGGVVNFITKSSVEGGQVTAQYVQPKRDDGAEEKRLGLTYGKGNLGKDGWNLYGTIDAHKRAPLLARDRSEYSTVGILTNLGRAPSLGSGGSAMPANFTTAANKTAQNPYFASGCAAPYSIPGAKSTCILNTTEYGMALYQNDQLSFYGRGTRRFSEDHQLTVDLSYGIANIYQTRNPTQTTAVGGIAAQLPSSSRWYPGGSGGVPAVANLNGAPLNVTWSVADLGLGTQRDQQKNMRFGISDENRFGAWDTRFGLVFGKSQRFNYYESGFVTGQGLNDGLKNGVLNPFGLQDGAGLGYLASISVDGQKNRDSESTFTGLDATASRPLMQLGGGQMSLAVGVDLHRDTTRDDKLAIQNQVTYLGGSASHGQGARNVAAVYAELDMPFTKTLTVNLAGRDDHFSDFGNTFNPKLSFRWQPGKTLMFRGSANTGFRAPTLFDRYGYRLPGATTTTAAKWDDPVLCPGGTPGVAGTGKAQPGYVASTVCNATFPRQAGSNPDLIPEKSRGWTLGTVLEPINGMTVSLDYWNIRMTDMLANLPEQVYFLYPEKYQSYFVRNTDGTIAYIKNTTMNLGGQKAAGIDFSASYTLPNRELGTFKLQLDGTWLAQFDNQLEKDSAWISNVGRFGVASNGTTSSLPIITFRTKMSSRIHWSRGDWGAQWTQNYNSGYTDQNLVAQQYWRDIKPYISHNVTLTYRGFEHIDIVAGITNLLDAAPPQTNHSGYTYGYLSSAASPIGRSFNLRATYSF